MTSHRTIRLAAMLCFALLWQSRAGAADLETLTAQGRLVEAEATLKPMYEEAVKTKDAGTQLRCLLLYATAQKARTNYYQALEYYGRALSIAPSRDKAEIYREAAFAALEGEFFDKARDLAKQGLSSQPSRDCEAGLLDCLGAAYFFLGDKQSYSHTISDLNRIDETPEGRICGCIERSGGGVAIQDALNECPGEFIRFSLARDLYLQGGRTMYAAAMEDSIYMKKSRITSTTLSYDMEYMDGQLANETLRQETAQLQADKEQSQAIYRRKLMTVIAGGLLALMVLILCMTLLSMRLRSKHRSRETASRLDIMTGITARMREPLEELTTSLKSALDGTLDESDRESVIDALIKSEAITSMVGDLLEYEISNTTKTSER